MRREDREITDYLEIDSILQDAIVCRIGLAEGDEPYVVPLCFGYEDRTIYLHSAPEGKKISMLKENSRCCFEVDQCDNLILGEHPCAWGICYRSVIGFGRASFIEDYEEKKKGLNCIMHHYSDETYQFSDDEIENVCVIRIDIELMTGKKCD
ncbi:MAG TPA: pyridoxamine 5'-phosphate oxidase family protein [Methanoregula sp.]|nr:pyridoxamine 5'-phosphate oxidase family protein [Methanoregula sp.]